MKRRGKQFYRLRMGSVERKFWKEVKIFANIWTFSQNYVCDKNFNCCNSSHNSSNKSLSSFFKPNKLIGSSSCTFCNNDPKKPTDHLFF